MKQIRKGVFETNSSSSHSIAVKKDKGMYSYEEIVNSVFPGGIPNDWDGIIHIDGYRDMYFNWGWEVLKTFWAKARFALASYFREAGFYDYEQKGLKADEDDYPDEVKEIIALLKELLPGFKEIDFSSSNREGWYIYGDIDHQSAGLLQEYLGKKGVSLKDFLVNREYVVFIDNDNSCVKADRLEAGDIRAEDYDDVGFGIYDMRSWYE